MGLSTLDHGSTRLKNQLGAIFLAILLLGACWLIIGGTTEQWLGHDEDQFFAPGYLTVRNGLLPWRDYPLFHTPYYVLINGWLGEHSNHPFLAMRAFVGLSAWLMLVAVSLQCWSWLRGISAGLRTLATSSLLVLIMFSPVFYEVITNIWNHQTPACLLVFSICLHFLAAGQKRPWLWVGLSGISIGLAIGMRITFCPLLAPLGLATFLIPSENWKQRWLAAAAFSVGVLIALAPCLWMVAQAPESAWFSNFRYPKLSLMWRRYPFWDEATAKFVDPINGYIGQSAKDFRGRDITSKLHSTIGKTLRPNWPLLSITLLFGLLPVFWTALRSKGKNFPPVILALLLPFLIWGTMAPSRVNAQYWYAPLPYFALCIAYGISRMKSGIFPAVLVLFAASVTTFTLNRTAYAKAYKMGGEKWSPNLSDNMNRALRKRISHGPVLTLESGLITLAGLEVYPGLAIGEFGWRSAHLLSAEKRQKYVLLCPINLDAELEKRPPTAIFLLNNSEKRNAPMIAWAEAHNFRAEPFAGRYQIWLPAKPLAPMKPSP